MTPQDFYRLLAEVFGARLPGTPSATLRRCRAVAVAGLIEFNTVRFDTEVSSLWSATN